MDIRFLADLINDPRRADVLVSLNSGTTLRISPDAKAVLWEEVTLQVMWPVDDDILRVRRLVNISPDNVAHAEYARDAADGPAEDAA